MKRLIVVGVTSTHRIMKRKKKKPTQRSIAIQLEEMQAVISNQQNWIQYLRNNLDLVSEMFYGYMEMNGDVDKVLKHVEKKKEKDAKQEQSKGK